MTASVWRCSSSSSGSAMRLMAAALDTSAPLRRSNAHSSSARFAEVTAIR